MLSNEVDIWLAVVEPIAVRLSQVSMLLINTYFNSKNLDLKGSEKTGTQTNDMCVIKICHHFRCEMNRRGTVVPASWRFRLFSLTFAGHYLCKTLYPVETSVYF